MVKMCEALSELAAKYDAAQIIDFEELSGGYQVTCNKGKFHFTYDYQQLQSTQIPLFHWQVKRKYAEMQGLLKAETVKKPLAIRVKNICPQSTLGGGIAAVLLREIDLCEQLLSGDEIIQIFSVPHSSHPYLNAICTTRNGAKISMELGISHTAAAPVQMHEIVCRTGIITDVAVDTQTEQYPIYVYGKSGTAVYADTDYELYGMDEIQRDCIRFMLHALSAPEQLDTLRASAARQLALVHLALKGGMCS